MQYYFYDTNVLLEGDKKFLSPDKPILISDITLYELESIKTSYSKDEEIKFKARKAIKWLIENRNLYTVCFYTYSFNSSIDNNDIKIISTALDVVNNKKINKRDIIFVTYDLSCALLAEQKGLSVQLESEYSSDGYDGFVRVYCNTDEELADFYSKVNNKENPFILGDINVNEYLLIYHKDKIVDKYKYLGEGRYNRVPFLVAETRLFGKVKPIDPYQELVMDSFKTNKLTLVKGAAGTGKSLLSMAYLFKLLEEGKIDTIIIFCNTVATAGSARLGFYPGDRTEKLLDSQIGNFLISKLGSRDMVEDLIDKGQLLLLPMSDIRGFDTSGLHAGIYITEAQNLSVELLKLALQRIGEDSICILDGDNKTQVDLGLYAGSNNGLRRVSEIFRGHSFYGEITLKEIHRSKIAQVADLM